MCEQNFTCTNLQISIIFSSNGNAADIDEQIPKLDGIVDEEEATTDESDVSTAVPSGPATNSIRLWPIAVVYEAGTNITAGENEEIFTLVLGGYDKGVKRNSVGLFNCCCCGKLEYWS